MKLTIDTQVDTHDDIRKVLQILTSILDKKDSLPSSSVSSASSTTDTTDLMSMFGDTANQGTVEIKGTPPDFSSFLNLTAQKTEKKPDNPRVELY